jgi:hypothetical protein
MHTTDPRQAELQQQAIALAGEIEVRLKALLKVCYAIGTEYAHLDEIERQLNELKSLRPTKSPIAE